MIKFDLYDAVEELKSNRIISKAIIKNDFK